ncbi:uncharacterized protein N7484_006725 [Penicillium longicatenatum]|uniref:uncharacterized protein n=1 Tax=Penicillium longicatenatum TaxID=1561947 RepID=UPI002547D56D|nr:uncharacterized protein N7484_006725 [Penicillium longicatenatum]KAJ5644218.1 hypothetical protein N7484_006725 [Penicillium longicatenatum]
MTTIPIGFRVAQAVGFTGAAWLSGNIAALSMNAAPAVLRARVEDNLPVKNTVKLWRNLYESGKAQNPPVAALTASAFFYLAWSNRSSSTLIRQVARNSPALYGTAAILTLSIVPFTFVAMSSTNNALLAKTELDSEPSAQTSAEIDDLVKKWISLNGIRSLLPLAAGVFGIFAALA